MAIGLLMAVRLNPQLHSKLISSIITYNHLGIYPFSLSRITGVVHDI